jgi:uncharacterized FlaG/YvyC family protein
MSLKRMVGSIKAAIEDTAKYIGEPVSVKWDRNSGRYIVEVETLRQLRQIPGEPEWEVSKLPCFRPVTASVEFDGILFLCRMKELPAEMMKEAV